MAFMRAVLAPVSRVSSALTVPVFASFSACGRSAAVRDCGPGVPDRRIGRAHLGIGGIVVHGVDRGGCRPDGRADGIALLLLPLHRQFCSRCASTVGVVTAAGVFTHHLRIGWRIRHHRRVVASASASAATGQRERERRQHCEKRKFHLVSKHLAFLPPRLREETP